MSTLVVLWVIFYASHSILAADLSKKLIENLHPSLLLYYRLAYNIIAIMLMFFILRELKNILHHDHLMFDPGGTGFLLGILLGIAGIILSFLAFRQYDLEEFTGLDAFTGKRIAAETLVTTGLHRHVRHPLYSGIVLFLLGLAIVFPMKSVIISILVTYIYLPLGIYLEEQKLIGRFGKSYIDYAQHTNRIIPFIY